jgi:hypothetical protein
MGAAGRRAALGSDAAGHDEQVQVPPDQMQRTHGMFMLIGLAPWNTTSGLFAQLPLLVTVSPQGSQLASFMDIATNAANFPMLLFVLFQSRAACAQRNRNLVLSGTLYFGFGLSFVAVLGVVLLWDVTVMNASVFIIFFAFCAGIVGDLMMVVSFPYATAFANEFTSTLSTGISGHGLICNMLAIGQGVGNGDERRLFGFEVYMLILGLLNMLAFLAFVRVDAMRRKAVSDAPAESGGRGANPAAAAVTAVSGLGVPLTGWWVVAQQAWTNYTYFLLPSLLPYLAWDPATGEVNGELYMWLNLCTTAVCGFGSIVTLRVDTKTPGMMTWLNLVQTVAYLSMLGGAVLNIRGDGLGWLMPRGASDALLLLLCAVLSFLNGFIKTWIFKNCDAVPYVPDDGAGGASLAESKPMLRGGEEELNPSAARIDDSDGGGGGGGNGGWAAHVQRVSRNAGIASQLAALSAASTMFICGPLLGFFPA